MYLVAGLGNPGEEYALTPHNLGFLTVDRLAEQHGIRVTRKDSHALIGVGEIDGREVMLAKPQMYMNLSGESLAPLMEKHSIGTDRLIVVYDELDLPWMSLRIKPKGSAAGHNGMKSVIGSLGATIAFAITLSLLFTTPDLSPAWSGFLMKDLVLMGAALWTAADSLRAIGRRKQWP